MKLFVHCTVSRLLNFRDLGFYFFVCTFRITNEIVARNILNTQRKFLKYYFIVHGVGFKDFTRHAKIHVLSLNTIAEILSDESNLCENKQIFHTPDISRDL